MTMGECNTVDRSLGAGTWDTIVAWFYVVASLVGTIVSTYLVHLFGHILVASGKVEINGPNLMLILGFVVSIVLVVGSVHRIPGDIKARLVFNDATTIALFALVVLIAGKTGGSGFVMIF